MWRDVKYINGKLPLKAVSAGISDGNELVYICRSWLNYDEFLQIGTYALSKDKPCNLINANRIPVVSDNYQVRSRTPIILPVNVDLTTQIIFDQILTKDKHTQVRWESATNQLLPTGAIQGGVSTKKNPLYICRCLIQQIYYVGSVILKKFLVTSTDF